MVDWDVRMRQIKADIRYAIENGQDVRLVFTGVFHPANKALIRAEAYLRPRRKEFPLLVNLIGHIRKRWLVQSAYYLRPSLTERQRLRLGWLDDYALSRRASNQDYRRKRALEEKENHCVD